MFSGTPRYRYFLGAIVLAGLALRINGLWHSLTADEASALLRLQYNSFGEMLENGVKPDGHPALTQVWLWFWTKLFGISEFSVRLPFAIAGTLSIAYAAGIARKWFSETTALAVAAGLAFLEFPIMYSQLARPYAPGLLFSLMAAYYWTVWMQRSSKRRQTGLRGFVISAVLAMYTHYFSFFFVAMVGLTGLFFLNRDTVRAYLLAGVACVILFLPHTGIFLNQLKTGGIGQAGGGWLSAPDAGFLWSHLVFVFNESKIVLAGVLLSCGITIFFLLQRHGSRRYALIALGWWAVPLFTGFFYSIWRNPVLQHSVLLFSFPFLLMFAFSWMEDYLLQLRISFALLIAGALAVLAHTGIRHRYDLLDHFGRLRELVEADKKYSDQFGASKITRFYNVDAPYFVSYYWDKFNFHPQVKGTITNGNDELRDFRAVVENAQTEYFFYCWSTKYSPYEALDIIREKYPFLVKREYYYNSEVYLFSRVKAESVIEEKTTTAWGLLTENKTTQWTSLEKKRPVIPFASFTLDSSNQFSPALEKKLVDIAKSPNAVIDIRCWAKPSSPDAEVVLVADFSNTENGVKKSFHWTGRSSRTQLADTTLQPVYYSFLLPHDVGPDDVVSIYAFIPGKKPVLVSFLEARVYPGNPIIYGRRGDYY